MVATSIPSNIVVSQVKKALMDTGVWSYPYNPDTGGDAQFEFNVSPWGPFDRKLALTFRGLTITCKFSIEFARYRSIFHPPGMSNETHQVFEALVNQVEDEPYTITVRDLNFSLMTDPDLSKWLSPINQGLGDVLRQKLIQEIEQAKMLWGIP